MVKVVVDQAGRDELTEGLDGLAPAGARRMLAVALEAEVDAHLAAFREERDDAGHRLVVRNGHAKPRQVTTVAGAVEARRPGWMTGGLTRPPGRGSASGRRSCRRGVGGARR